MTRLWQRRLTRARNATLTKFLAGIALLVLARAIWGMR